ncbi:MAG TPA: sulfatase [Verrucomicrobiales bacterium]|nr:sulfatase [Verrucomicrobiales bacterium]
MRNKENYYGDVKTLKFSVLSFWFVFVCLHTSHGAERPNVVWIVSEDNSIHYLKHFFKEGIEAPHIEALATKGLTFNHAFSNAPVCSVARTTLATGCYGPRIGTQFHRKYVRVPMPDGLRMFPAYLRDTGYYTTNNSKTDYNAIPAKDVWDVSSRSATWRNRPDPSKPFFHMQSHAESHESRLHFSQTIYEQEKTVTDPDSVHLADYFPDTPLFRYTHARYLDRMTVIDGIVGDTVEKLKTDGLLEDTFIFYFGDHGGVLPRGKGYIHESGLHVPLVVRIPENFKHLVDAEQGSRVNGFVSFIDFGPTVLQLAGVKIPSQVDGRPFLGKGISMEEVDSRDEAFGYADRFDEKYDFVRSIRKGKYQYIRQYQPYLPDGLQNNYRYKMLAYKEWRELYHAGKLKVAQEQFFKPKTAEALYDVVKDPHQVNNLAGVEKFDSVLRDLRGRLQKKVKQLPDLSFYPESHLAEHAMENPVVFGKLHQKEIETLVDTADLALFPFEQAKPMINRALSSGSPMIRYWAAMACSSFGREAGALADSVESLLKDPSEIVQVRAAEFLGLIRQQNPQPILTRIVNSTRKPILATEALNSVVLFKDFHDYPVSRSDFDPVSKGADIDDRLNYINGIPYPPKPAKPKRVK